jgi:predicted ATPase
LLLFSVLYGFWVGNLIAFNGDVIQGLAAKFLALAERQGATVPLMMADRLMGISWTCAGDIVQGRAHLDRAIALYDPVEHRPLATRFAVDIGVSILSFRSLALWCLGYPQAARTDGDQVLRHARECDHAAMLMHALANVPFTHLWSGNYAVANTLAQELVALADEKGAPLWKALGMMHQDSVSALTGKASHADQLTTSGITAYRSTGATMWIPLHLSYLAKVHAEREQFDEAWRTIHEATTVMETTMERSYEAEIRRTSGEIALISPAPEVAKAEGYFERALAIARSQQAKSWELRAAMSMARLWRDQGKRQQAHDLLAPVYGWFAEGFDTLDLKEAKALLEQLKP